VRARAGRLTLPGYPPAARGSERMDASALDLLRLHPEGMSPSGRGRLAG
jgi:hypothetical protein